LTPSIVGNSEGIVPAESVHEGPLGREHDDASVLSPSLRLAMDRDQRILDLLPQPREGVIPLRSIVLRKDQQACRLNITGTEPSLASPPRTNPEADADGRSAVIGWPIIAIGPVVPVVGRARIVGPIVAIGPPVWPIGIIRPIVASVRDIRSIIGPVSVIRVRAIAPAIVLSLRLGSH